MTPKHAKSSEVPDSWDWSAERRDPGRSQLAGTWAKPLCLPDESETLCITRISPTVASLALDRTLPCQPSRHEDQDLATQCAVRIQASSRTSQASQTGQREKSGKETFQNSKAYPCTPFRRRVTSPNIFGTCLTKLVRHLFPVYERLRSRSGSLTSRSSAVTAR